MDRENGTADESERLRTEIERLRSQVEELVPFARADAELGASIGPHVADHDCIPKCDDCQWHEESLLLLARIDSGEFDPMPKVLHVEEVKDIA